MCQYREVTARSPTIVVAPDSFKGSISAVRAAAAIAAGWHTVDSGADLHEHPMADGGEGTLAALEAALQTGRAQPTSTVRGERYIAARMPVDVSGPLGRLTHAYWLHLTGAHLPAGGIAVIELASCSGIELLAGRRAPEDTHTIGTGQAITAALDYGVHELIIAIGSSASTDGGAGILHALGAEFFDARGTPIPPGLAGLRHLAAVDVSRLRPLPLGGVRIWADVAVPLTGPTGAAQQFGEQKGFRRADLPAIDAMMSRYADLLEAACDHRTDQLRTRQLRSQQLRTRPHTGAAGGAGFGLAAWGAQLQPGAAKIAQFTGLAQAIQRADLVITGEGAFDQQSAHGKITAYIAAQAHAAEVPVALIAGRIDPQADSSAFAATVSLTTLADSGQSAHAEPERWLHLAGQKLAKTRHTFL